MGFAVLNVVGAVFVQQVGGDLDQCLGHRGTPSHHPLRGGVFHYKLFLSHIYFGVPLYTDFLKSTLRMVMGCYTVALEIS